MECLCACVAPPRDYKTAESDRFPNTRFNIRHGEAVGIIGPSGTGKSTILKIMAGLLAPDKVFQSAALFDSLTVHENVGFLLYENSAMPEDQIAQLVTETLAAVGLKEVEERLPSELSGGMKKRVALARSIIFDTKKDLVEPELCYRCSCMMNQQLGLIRLHQPLEKISFARFTWQARMHLGSLGRLHHMLSSHINTVLLRAVGRLIFLYEGKVVWQGMTHEFSASTNPIVRQFAAGSLDGSIRY